MKDKVDILQTLDWENFNFPLTLSQIELSEKYYKIERNSEIEIWRDDKLKLTGKIKGFVQHPDNLKYNNGKPLKKGTFVKGINIKGKSNGSDYIIRGCLINGTSFKMKKVGDPIQFEAELIFDSIVNSTIEKNVKVARIIDWHICSSKNIIFPRATHIYSNIKPYKFRSGIDETPDLNDTNILNYRGMSRDFFMLKVDKLLVIIQTIKKENLPSWAGGIAIEYRNDISFLPTPLMRQKISDFISFIFGFQLLNIGSTHFNKEITPVVSYGKSPWGNSTSICEMSPMPPFVFNTGRIEINLSKLLKTYIEISDKYELGDALWKLWIGRVQPLGTNLPIYSSGIETLVDIYLNENKIIKKSSKTEKKKYRELIQVEYDSLSTKLKDFQFGKFVLNKLMNPMNYGIGEKMKLFFDSISFNLDENSIESKALQARNTMAHSSLSDVSDDEIEEFVRLTNAYITLYNRLILRLLDYKEKYIDYYNYGHPLTKMTDNITVVV